MTGDAAHRSLWQTSDAIFGGALIVGIILSLISPLSMPDNLPRWLYIISGGGLIFGGIAILVLTKQQMDHAHQPTAPGRATTRLITEGIFQFSRNPMYLGLVFAFGGIGLFFKAGWLLILLIPLVILSHYVLILPEEKYLNAKFGDEYKQYRKSVRRWI